MSLVASARISGTTSQAVFWELMQAMAEPGTIRALPGELLDRGVAPAAWPVLALGDVDVTVNVDDVESAPLGLLIADATGARIRPLQDAWAVVLTEPRADLLARVAVGDALHPERGARVSLAVGDLDGGASTARERDLLLHLRGPGIAGERSVGVDRLDPDVAALLGRSSGTFPAGFDTWLVADSGYLVGIPRSTAIRVERPCADQDSTAGPPPDSGGN